MNKKKKYLEDYHSMKFFLDQIYKLKKFRKYKILIKLHPKHSKDYIESVLGKEIKKLNASITDINLKKIFPSIKYSFGLTTFPLLLSAKLKIITYHCKLPSQKINLIKNSKILSFYKYFKSVNT
jgi:hypothetical protein